MPYSAEVLRHANALQPNPNALANAARNHQAAMLANTWPRYRKPWPWPKPPGALRTILCVAVGDASPKRQRIALAAMRRQWPELTRRLLNARA